MPQVPYSTLSLNAQFAALQTAFRRLRIPPKTHTYTKTGAISVAASGAVPLHNDTGTVLGVSSVRVTLGVAPSTQPVIVDIMAGGASIFTGTLPQVAVGSTIGTAVVPDVGEWIPGAALYVNVTQGDAAATDLHVTLVAA